jgi:two-component system sensor histidine kinase UhpB
MSSAELPLELPRLVMRRTLALALAALLVIAALGLLRAAHDIRDEVDGAVALAGVVARLSAAAEADDAAALAALADAQAQRPLRHLALQVQAGDGRLLLAPVSAPAPPHAWFDALLAAHRWLLPALEPARVAWTLPRGGGERWTVSLAASPESERREALGDLLQTLLLVGAALAALLVAMHWNVRHAFRPLAAIVRAIEGIERRDPRAVRDLPPMPIGELQTVANAIAHLATSLEHTEDERRRLGRRLMTLQEDERAHLARELHDEFGQRLTALRVDAAWLGKRVDDAAVRDVVHGMSERCAELQRDIRGLLARLRPLGPDGDDEAPTLDRLVALLRALLDGWSTSDAACRLTVAQRYRGGRERPLDDAAAARVTMPRELMLGVYRLSQEALTNAARHARAQRVDLRLALEGDGTVRTLEWSVRDDGVGIADIGSAMQQGSGLGGMRERVWSLGGELHCTSAEPGLALSARLSWEAAR